MTKEYNINRPTGWFLCSIKAKNKMKAYKKFLRKNKLGKKLDINITLVGESRERYEIYYGGQFYDKRRQTKN